MKAGLLKAVKTVLPKSAVPQPALQKEKGFGSVLSVVSGTTSPPGRKASTGTFQRPSAQKPAVLLSGRYSVAHEESQDNLKERSKTVGTKENRSSAQATATLASVVPAQGISSGIAVIAHAPESGHQTERVIKPEAKASESAGVDQLKGSRAAAIEGRQWNMAGLIVSTAAQREGQSLKVTTLKATDKPETLAKSNSDLTHHVDLRPTQANPQRANAHAQVTPQETVTRKKTRAADTVASAEDHVSIRQSAFPEGLQKNASSATERSFGAWPESQPHSKLVSRSANNSAETSVPVRQAPHSQIKDQNSSHKEIPEQNRGKAEQVTGLKHSKLDTAEAPTIMNTGRQRTTNGTLRTASTNAQSVRALPAGEVQDTSKKVLNTTNDVTSPVGLDLSVKSVVTEIISHFQSTFRFEAKVRNSSGNLASFESDTKIRAVKPGEVSNSSLKSEEFIPFISSENDSPKVKIHTEGDSVYFKLPKLQLEGSAILKQGIAPAPTGPEVRYQGNFGNVLDPADARSDGKERRPAWEGRPSEVIGKPMKPPAMDNTHGSLKAPETVSPLEKAFNMSAAMKLTPPVFDAIPQAAAIRNEERTKRTVETSHGKPDEPWRTTEDSHRSEFSNKAQEVRQPHSSENESRAGAGQVREIAPQINSSVATSKVVAPHQNTLPDNIRVAIQQALELSKQRVVEPDELRISVPLGEMGTIDIDIINESESYSLKIAADPQAIAILADQREQLVSWLRQHGHPVEQIDISPRFTGEHDQLESEWQLPTQSGRDDSGSPNWSEDRSGDVSPESGHLPKPSLAGGRVWTA